MIWMRYIQASTTYSLTSVLLLIAPYPMNLLLYIRFCTENTFQYMGDDTPAETWRSLTTQLQKSHPGVVYLHLIKIRAVVFHEHCVNTVDSLEPFRHLRKGPLISAGSYSPTIKHAIDMAGNLIAFVVNSLPILIFLNLNNGFELINYDRDNFYSPTSARGYIDYPAHDSVKK